MTSKLVRELLADLKSQIQQAKNQAASSGKISLIDTMRSIDQTAKLLEFEINKSTPPPERAERETMKVDKKVFRAFLLVAVKGKPMEIPIYPRSKKKTTFTDIESAVKRLENAAKKINHDTTGRVYLYQNGERVANVHQIGL